jgi:hypothetical protein
MPTAARCRFVQVRTSNRLLFLLLLLLLLLEL